MGSRTIRFLLTSDWHLFGARGSRFRRLADLRLLCLSGRYDALLHGGDLVEPDGGASFKKGLHAMLEAASSMEHIMVVVGNNDLDAVVSNDGVPLEEAVAYMAKTCASCGVDLLDQAPCVVKGVRFVGNFAGFDGSLFRATPLSRGQTAHDHMEAEAVRWRQGGVATHPGALHAQCRRTLLRHLDENVSTPTILTTHTVPVPDMLKYGSSERHDAKNAYMGWDEAHAGGHLWGPHVIAHLCGHVHRSYDLRVDTQYVRGLPLINASGNDEIREVEVVLDEAGRVVSLGTTLV